MLRWYDFKDSCDVPEAIAEVDLTNFETSDNAATSAFVPATRRLRLRVRGKKPSYAVVALENVIRKEHIIPVPPVALEGGLGSQYEEWAFLNPWMWSHEQLDV